MFLWLKTLYRKRAVTWPFIFYTIIWTLSENQLDTFFVFLFFCYFIKNRDLMLENLTYAVDNIFFNWYTLANL